MGVGPLIFITMLAATPDVSGLGTGVSKPAAPAIGAAVNMGGKWGTVTSVRRSPERNRAVGGARNSWHLHGRAIDIARRPGVRHVDIEAAYRKAGYILIESLDEGDHSHFAFGLPGERGRSGRVAGVQLAAMEVKLQPVCPPSAAPPSRRRPDRFDACQELPEPPAKYRPISMAEVTD
jgi:hypothetical protein